MDFSKTTSVHIHKNSTKSAEKKHALAMHAISSLAELGFARINLRDVAKRSGVSLGVIHYYFESKTELLIYCVGMYKEDFIVGLNGLITQARQLDVLCVSVADYLADTIDRHAQIHRLWYDVRAQAQFDQAFQPAVEEVEHALIGVFSHLLVKLQELEADADGIDPLKLYVTLDGWFRYYLQRKLMGETDSIALFRKRALAEFALIFKTLSIDDRKPT